MNSIVALPIVAAVPTTAPAMPPSTNDPAFDLIAIKQDRRPRIDRCDRRPPCQRDNDTGAAHQQRGNNARDDT